MTTAEDEQITSATAPSDPQFKPRAAWTVLGLLILFMLVNYSDRTVLALAAQPMMEELEISASQFGLISSSFYFLYSLGAIALGVVASKVSVKWFLAGLTIFWGLTQLPIFLFAGVGVLLASRIALGAAEGPAAAVSHATTYTWFPANRRGLPATLLSAGPALSQMVVAPILTLIMVAAGWRVGFLVVAVLSFAWAIGWLMFGKEGPFKTPATPALEASGGHGNARGVDWSEVKRALLSRTTVALFLVTFPVFGLVTVILSWLPAYLEGGLGFSTTSSGLIFTLPATAALVFMLAVGAVSDRMVSKGLSRKSAWVTVPVLAVITGALMILTVPIVGGDHRILGLALLVIGYGLVNPIVPLTFVAVGTITASRARTVTLSVFTALISFSGVVAPWLTGIALDLADTRIAGYNMVFVVVTVIMIIGGIIALVFANPDADAVDDIANR